jgi:putative hydrolase of the HAD superfamily
MANINVKKLKGVIFDYGGTIDSAGEHWSEVLWRGYIHKELAVERDDFRAAYVHAERQLAREPHILPHHNFHDLLNIKVRLELTFLLNHSKYAASYVEKDAAAVADYCYEQARGCIETARPVLEELHKRYPMVLVSNFYGNVNAVLSDFKLDHYFQEVIESAVVGVRKPDPQIFQLGVDALKLKPEEVLVVGDSYRKDILPAESIGCQVAWLKGKGWTDEEDSIRHPNAITKLSEVLKMLKIYT